MIDLDIDRLAGGGDGVGRDAEGRVVFVPLTAPGDRVRVEIVKSKPRWASARMTSLLVGAANRREPPCSDFGHCGGCRLQHIPEAAQAEAKRAIVEQALRRIGRIECEVPDLVQAGDPLGYRNRITLTARSGTIGFRELRDPTAIAEIDECLLAEQAVRSAAKQLSRGQGLPTGGELRVTVRASDRGAVALLVEGGTHPGSPDDVVADVNGLASYWWHNTAGERHRLAGEETFRETWQGIRFDLPPSVFLQSNRAVSAAMDTWLDSRIGRLEGLQVVDLYSGVGARAIRWALGGADVTSCEVDALAVGASVTAAQRAGADLRFCCDRVEHQSSLLAGADVVIVNPPRTGLGAGVRTSLSRAGVPRMAYISCDPATLARDLKDISATYDVVEVQPFDAFPQTAHVETIAWLRTRASLAQGSGS